MASHRSRVDEILEFWFGPALADPEALARQAELWFKADPRFNQEVKTQFGRDLEAVAKGDLDTWRTSPRARLAGIVLLDQFSRNIYRGTARAFTQDPKALTLCLEAVATGEDRQLHPVERLFFYMPLQHGEDPEIQERSVRQFSALEQDAPQELKSYLKTTLDFAKEHRDIIRRFGRFPHRNAVLGRMSTPEEEEFLRTEAKRYGQ